ncbi:unnamed protein product [Pseudo-nitzschia multistriata]|uniref:Uncharacterized protein n=1 Tax=Pseudo-nitzschia multistriata TaxID=183589 RepID=A0A448ZT82_9STRA|nr:unnamed protein product [Pseudo-nitzschia multistriata]
MALYTQLTQPCKRRTDIPRVLNSSRKLRFRALVFILISEVITFVLMSSSILVLLVFGYKIIQVGFSLSELHLVHTLTSVPMKEGLATEHDSKLIGDTLPCFLDGSRVTNEDTGHLKSLGWDVTNGCLEVVRDPFHKVGRMLVDHLKHLVIDLFTGHTSSEHHCACQVSSVTRIGSTHHILGIECLLSELGHRQDTEPLRAVSSQRSKSDQEEVKTRERNHVNGKLSKIAVQLSGESKRTGSSGDGICDQVVKIAVSGVRKLESTEANVIKCFVIKSERLVGILNKLVNGKGGIVRLDNSIGNLGGRDDTVCADDTIRVFLLDLGNKKGSHTGSGTSSHRVSDLETLKDFASFGLLANGFHDVVYEFCSLCVMTLGPVISSSALSEDEVIGTEKRSVCSTSNGVHGSGFQIGKNGTGNISSFLPFVEVNANSLQLELIITNIVSGGVNAVLSGHDLRFR